MWSGVATPNTNNTPTLTAAEGRFCFISGLPTRAYIAKAHAHAHLEMLVPTTCLDLGLSLFHAPTLEEPEVCLGCYHISSFCIIFYYKSLYVLIYSL